MGCDIHAHVEVKLKGQWHHYHAPYINRDYSLFSKMANVRNGSLSSMRYVKPISKPRGMPEDISLITKVMREGWGGDGHSDSWLGSAEVCELIKWYDVRMAELHEEYSKKTEKEKESEEIALLKAQLVQMDAALEDAQKALRHTDHDQLARWDHRVVRVVSSPRPYSLEQDLGHPLGYSWNFAEPDSGYDTPDDLQDARLVFWFDN